MTAHGPEYRGRSAVELARDGAPFTSVAELLWTGALPERAPPWPARRADLAGARARPAPAARAARRWRRSRSPCRRSRRPIRSRFDAHPEAVLARARRLIPRLAASYALALDPRRLAARERHGRPGARARDRARLAPTRSARSPCSSSALVLCADHELNASTFAARVAASTGADLYACLSARGRCALAARCTAARASRSRCSRARRRPGRRRRRGARPHAPRRAPARLRPHALPGRRPARRRRCSRPRSRSRRARRACARSPRSSPRWTRRIAPSPTSTSRSPAACAALDLPTGQGPAIFAIGRCAGWVAHVLEQYDASFVLRPRARFVGETF